MNLFVSLGCGWALNELILSLILYLSYQGLLKTQVQANDRYLFLKLTFLSLPVIPFLPVYKSFMDVFKTKSILQNSFSAMTHSMSAADSVAISHEQPLWLGYLVLLALLCYFAFIVKSIFTVIRSALVLNNICREGERRSLVDKIPLILHHHDIAPAAVGIVKPVILLPIKVASSVTESELDLIVQHEMQHIRRNDYLFNLLRLAVQTLLVFSPFASKISKAFEEEMELSCDELIVFQNSSAKKEYGALLAKLATGVKFQSNLIYSGFFASGPFITRRIQAMKNFSSMNSRTNRISLLFVLFCVISGTGISALGLDSKTKVELPGLHSSVSVSEFISTLSNAKNGDRDAQNKIGEMYQFGEGVPVDYLGALDWYKKASEQGHSVAPNHIAALYLNGEGVKRDLQEACKWLLLSAERGYAVAQYNVAHCYQEVKGMEDPEKAKYWYARAEKSQPGISDLIRKSVQNYKPAIPSVPPSAPLGTPSDHTGRQSNTEE